MLHLDIFIVHLFFFLFWDHKRFVADEEAPFGLFLSLRLGCVQVAIVYLCYLGDPAYRPTSLFFPHPPIEKKLFQYGYSHTHLDSSASVDYS